MAVSIFYCYYFAPTSDQEEDQYFPHLHIFFELYNLIIVSEFVGDLVVKSLSGLGLKPVTSVTSNYYN